MLVTQSAIVAQEETKPPGRNFLKKMCYTQALLTIHAQESSSHPEERDENIIIKPNPSDRCVPCTPVVVLIERDSMGREKKTHSRSNSSSSVVSESSSTTTSSSAESSKQGAREPQEMLFPVHRRNKIRSNDEIPGLKLSIMAEFQFSLGNYRVAFDLWGQSLQVQREELGERHDVVGQTLSRRGMALAKTGNLYESILDLERAVHIKQEGLTRKTTDQSFIDVADTFIQLGYVQQDLGFYVEAMHSLSMALSLKEGVFGKSHESTARIVCEMGNFYHRRRRYQHALESYKRGLALYKGAGVPTTHHCVVWVRRCMSDKNILARKAWTCKRKHGEDI